MFGKELEKNTNVFGRIKSTMPTLSPETQNGVSRNCIFLLACLLRHPKTLLLLSYIFEECHSPLSQLRAFLCCSLVCSIPNYRMLMEFLGGHIMVARRGSFGLGPLKLSPGLRTWAFQLVYRLGFGFDDSIACPRSTRGMRGLKSTWLSLSQD